MKSDGNLGADALADANNAWWSVSAWQERHLMQATSTASRTWASAPRLGAWLELRADDPAAVLQGALSAGLTQVKHPAISRPLVAVDVLGRSGRSDAWCRTDKRPISDGVQGAEARVPRVRGQSAHGQRLARLRRGCGAPRWDALGG